MMARSLLWALMRAAAALFALLPAAALAQAPMTWHHGILEAKSDAGIFMMVQQGFAEKQGLKLELFQFKSDAVGLRALLAGDIDSYDGAFAGTIAASERGIDVKVLGCHWPGLPHGIFVRSTVATPQDLRDKTFAISSPNSLPDVLGKALLAKYGIPVSEVRFANLGSDLDRYKSLVAGVADATVVSGEYQPIAAKDGIRLLVAGRDVLPLYMRVCMFATAKNLAARHEAAVRFMAAEMTALGYAITHRDETLKLTREITGAKPDDPRPAYIYDDAVRTHSIDPEISLPMDKINFMMRQAVADKTIPAPYDMSKMIEPSVREEALKRVGK
jgi:NitT/TauT family transport system substrate-binding protein